MLQTAIDPVAWIRAHLLPEGGVCVSSRKRVPYPEVSGYLVPSLYARGEIPSLKEARRELEAVKAVARQAEKLKAKREQVQKVADTVSEEMSSDQDMRNDMWDLLDYIDYNL